MQETIGSFNMTDLRSAIGNLFLAAILCVHSLPTLSLEYDFQGESTATAENGQTVRSVIVKGHARLRNDKIRVDLDPSATATSHMAGYYLVGLEGGRRLDWINAKTREFYEVLADVRDAGIILPPPQEKAMLQLKNIHISVENLGEGPELQAHPTVHYRFSQTLDVQMSASHVIHNHFTVDYYFPSDLPNFVNPLMFRAVFASPEKVPENYMQTVRSEVAKLPKLAPLRSVYQDENVDGITQVKTLETTTFEVSHLHLGALPTEVFEIQDGLKKIDRPRVASASGAAKGP
jgi:hypothetical protein